MAGPEKPLLTDRNLHLELGFVAADSPTALRVGGSAEIGICERKDTVCFDVGGGIQTTVSSSDNIVNQRDLVMFQAHDLITIAPYLRLGVLFNPAKLISFGPVLRLGPATNIADVDEAKMTRRGPSFSTATLVNADLFLMAGLRVLLSGERYGVTMDVGAAKYPDLPSSEGGIPSSFGLSYQNSLLVRF